MGEQYVKVRVMREPGMEDLPLPTYKTKGSVGMDLHAAVEKEVVISPGERRLIPTGIRVAIPEGYEGQVRPRSGLAINYGVGLLNSPGTIDSDYRGEIRVVVVNLGEQPFVIKRGDRIAQLVISPVIKIEWEEVNELPHSERGEGGFGHTGI
ncbi:MAG: dUTP diphosphatase [Candidatus Hydrogenedentes bacterium]|nr:dUTP diphosphatase [Candidatus Hydrogenedentota bacterium]